MSNERNQSKSEIEIPSEVINPTDPTLPGAQPTVAEQVKISAANEIIASETAIYVACAKAYRLGGWIKEQKNQVGDILQRNVDLKWTENILTTDDPKKKEFIENSMGFKSGEIRKARDMKEAREWIRRITLIHVGQQEGSIAEEERVLVKLDDKGRSI